MTYALNSELTYDWENGLWSLPINAIVSKVTKIGGQAVSFAGGLRNWLETPDSGPEGLGLWFVVSFVFPK